MTDLEVTFEHQPDLAEVEVPRVVAESARGRHLRPVWRNTLGGLTFEVGRGADRCFVKWAPPASGLDLVGEAARMRWVAPFTNVPRVVDAGSDDDGAWLVTTPLAGESAVSERWKHSPATAVVAIGEALRHLHEDAPVARCPFSWSVEDRLALARERVAASATRPEDWHPAHSDLSAEEALARLEVPPPVDQIVVCHGDTCAPNTLLLDDGRWSGLVDLGALGTADRWADLAIATWSTQWNYGPEWEGLLLDTYGIDADPDRTAYYRLLWDLT